MKISKNARKYMAAATFVAVFPIMSLVVVIALSDAKFSDFFTNGRASVLKDRDSSMVRDIVVDNTTIIDNGGIKTLSENLVKMMALKRPAWRFIVLVSKDNLHDGFSQLALHNNVKLLRVDSNYNEAFLFMRNFLNFITFGLFHNKITQICFYNTICIDDKCDVFFDTYAELAINDFSIPKVSLIHDLVYLDVPKHSPKRRKKWIVENSRSIVKYSKKIITISDFSKKRIIKEYKVKDNFVRAIYTNLASRIKNHNASFEATNSVLKKYSLTKNKYLIYTSCFWPHKNHKRLLRAFSNFLSSHSTNVKLAIVGKIPMIKHHGVLGKILKNKSLHGESDKVVFTNFVTDEELNILLSNSLALVFPSLYEGFGMPVIEAMAAGVPVICSNAGSLPEVAGNAALFFNPQNIDEIAEAISKIVNDEGLRKKLIQLGYKQAEKFTDSDVMIDEYLKILEEAMEN